MNDHPPTPLHRHYFEGNLLAQSLLNNLMFPKHDSIFPMPPKAGRGSPSLLYPFTLWPNGPKVFGVRISLPPWPSAEQLPHHPNMLSMPRAHRANVEGEGSKPILPGPAQAPHPP